MSKGKKKTTSTGSSSTTQTLNPWSQNQYTDQVGRVRGLLDSAPVEAYSGRSNADFGASADQYMNPYESQVIDSTMADITRMNEGQNAAARGRAAASGAYGGSGVAVSEALNNAEAQREMARTGSQLRYQGYNDARGLFGQDIDNEYNDFLRMQAERQQRVGNEMGLLGSIPTLVNSSGTSTQTDTQSSNPGLLGTIGALGGIASQFVPGGGLASMFMRRTPTLGNEVVNGMTRDGFRVG
jgi:hypothetical protein